MKYLYKIYSGYDGFTPRRIPERLLEGGLLRLGWARYLEAVEKGDEVWVYFFGPGGFENGVYARARVRAIDFGSRVVLARVFESSTETPLSDATVADAVATLVRARGIQVFLLPEELSVTPGCTVGGAADTCARRLCEDCPTWRAFYQIDPETVRQPSRLTVTLTVFAPGYWVSPPRGFLISEISPAIRRTTELFGRFKSGTEALKFPLALAMKAALRRRQAAGFDALVPIPLSPDKIAEGELNRTLVLAEELETLLGVPVRSVVSLSEPISKRASGLSGGSFEAAYRRRLVIDASAADITTAPLVDDVSTHGSTLDTVSRALLTMNKSMAIGATAAGQMVVKSAVVDANPLRAS